MKRVCVIGNSHLVALKDGWDELRGELADRIQPTYFGAPRDRLGCLRVQDGALVPEDDAVKRAIEMTSGGKSSIEVEEYETFIITGLGYKFSPLMALLDHYLTTAFSTVPEGVFYISGACLREAAKGLLTKTLALSIAGMIQSISKARIILVPTPLPAEPLLEKPVGGKKFRDFLENGDAPRAYNLFNISSVELLRERGIAFFEQPNETRQHDFLTRKEFCRKRRRSDRLDVRHMNGSYGAVVWRKLLASDHI